METRKVGRRGWTASALGLGCMGMSAFYSGRDDAESVATVRAALDAGITLLDSGDFYGMGHNELLIREALKGRRRDQVALAIKFGALRDWRIRAVHALVPHVGQAVKWATRRQRRACTAAAKARQRACRSPVVMRPSPFSPQFSGKNPDFRKSLILSG